MAKASTFSSKYEAFRRALVEARADAGITQVQLAQRLGTTQSFVSKYERGERRIDVIEFIEIANALGIEPQEFFKRIVRPR